jgi:hypothetical protein
MSFVGITNVEDRVVAEGFNEDDVLPSWWEHLWFEHTCCSMNGVEDAIFMAMVYDIT